MAESPCRRCGHDAGSGVPQPRSCGHCPPVKCSDCGEPDDRTCSCWVALDGLPMADIKGLLALGDLSVGVVSSPGHGEAGGDPA